MTFSWFRTFVRSVRIRSVGKTGENKRGTQKTNRRGWRDEKREGERPLYTRKVSLGDPSQSHFAFIQTAMSARSEPLSIESLLQKQKQEKEAASKVCPFLCPLNRRSSDSQPKFLSKEERAKLAIAKRAQEIREQKEKDESSRRDRETLERDADELRMKERNSSSRYGRS
jgi:hypothetical protein